jgi:RNA polymerase sigma-70 factor (ECF subfamily)
MTTRELSALLEVAVDKLSDIDRIAFMLGEVEALSMAATAECLGLSEDAVRVRLHRAKARLREKLSDRVCAAATATFQFDDRRADRVVKSVLERIGTSQRPSRNPDSNRTPDRS